MLYPGIPGDEFPSGYTELDSISLSSSSLYTSSNPKIVGVPTSFFDLEFVSFLPCFESCELNYCGELNVFLVPAESSLANLLSIIGYGDLDGNP